MEHKIKKLEELAEISSGFQFRGAIKADPEGDVAVVQMSSIEIDKPIPWEDLDMVFLPTGSRPRYLKEGDLLFSARGLTNFAVVCCELPSNLQIVASQHFFLIRPLNEEIIPEFLSWQINQKPVQSKLEMISSGMTQKAIPLRELKTIPIVVPPVEHQKKLVALHQHVIREKAALEELISNRNKMMTGIAMDLHQQAQAEGTL